MFDALAELDVLVLGIFWDQLKDRFPAHSLQPALADHVGFSIGGAMPMRAVLTSADGQFVLQIQHDRFFMNWRATGKEYPRFSERHGPDGLLVRMQREFALFRTFVESRLGHVVRPARIELTKIDVFQRGAAWTDNRDLARLLPVTAAFGDAERPEVNLRSIQRSELGTSIVQVVTVMKDDVPDAVRIETRRLAPAGENLIESFELANIELNRIFFKMVPGATERFE